MWMNEKKKSDEGLDRSIKEQPSHWKRVAEHMTENYSTEGEKAARKILKRIKEEKERQKGDYNTVSSNQMATVVFRRIFRDFTEPLKKKFKNLRSDAKAKKDTETVVEDSQLPDLVTDTSSEDERRRKFRVPMAKKEEFADRLYGSIVRHTSSSGNDS
jgi:hypothetical protein